MSSRDSVWCDTWLCWVGLTTHWVIMNTILATGIFNRKRSLQCQYIKFGCLLTCYKKFKHMWKKRLV
jgi:hypothetical protein